MAHKFQNTRFFARCMQLDTSASHQPWGDACTIRSWMDLIAKPSMLLHHVRMLLIAATECWTSLHSSNPSVSSPHVQGYGMVEFSLASAALKCKTAMEAIENEMRPDSKRAGAKRRAGEPAESQSQVCLLPAAHLEHGSMCHPSQDSA